MGRRPVELGPSPGRVGALIEQQDFGEVVAQARPSLLVGTRDRSRSAGRDGGRLGQLGNGRVQSVADDVVAASRVVLQRAPEEIRQVGDVDRRPVLLSRAEHDQVAVRRHGVSRAAAREPLRRRRRRRRRRRSRLRACRVASSSRCSIGSFHATIAGALNGDSSVIEGVGPVDPRTPDVEVGLARAVECLDRRIDDRRVQVRAGLVAGTGRVDGPVRIAQQRSRPPAGRRDRRPPGWRRARRRSRPARRRGRAPSPRGRAPAIPPVRGIR